MTPFRFTFSANIFSREHLDADPVPVETYRGTLEAKHIKAAEEQAASIIHKHCQELEAKTGLMVGFEKLQVEYDDSPTEEGIRKQAAKVLKDIEDKELTRSCLYWHYQQTLGVFLTYQLVLEILNGDLPKSVLDAPISELAESLKSEPTEPLKEHQGDVWCLPFERRLRNDRT